MVDGWMPIAAEYRSGGWAILYARWADGWTFREGFVGLEYLVGGTPGRFAWEDGGRDDA